MAIPFHVGEKVKYTPKYCGAGEEKYIHVITEVNPDTKKCIIHTLNSCLSIGSSEVVDFDMIELLQEPDPQTASDEIISFVSYLFTDGRSKKPYTIRTATKDLEQWKIDGVDLPEGLTAEVLTNEFNKILRRF